MVDSIELGTSIMAAPAGFGKSHSIDGLFLEFCNLSHFAGKKSRAAPEYRSSNYNNKGEAHVSP
jgi:hypothetical protein